MKRCITPLVAASFAVSCINYTGLEGDGSDYTRPPYTCNAGDANDGASAAASLAPSSLDCHLRSSGSNWGMAMDYCAGLGSGWRLASKGEALQIASSSTVCRIPVPGQWSSWTGTCAGRGLAWLVFSSGGTTQIYIGSGYNALCVR